MTSEKNKKDLNPSSLLDLKAELLRKQDELKREKLHKTSKQKLRSEIFKKTSVWAKQNAGVLERAQRDLEIKEQEDDVMGRSRKQLEAKSRLYEAMIKTKDIPEEDGSQKFLVDFQQKAICTISEQREMLRKKQEEENKLLEEEEKRLLEQPIPESKDPQEQWIDYTDRFGRSRRCMRKDLPDLLQMDGKPVTEQNLKSENKNDLMSADMHRELIRQKWEALEKESMTNPDGPVHYANVQYNEIRTHGTGYYQFSKQEEHREEQLNTLKELRVQTKEQRIKNLKLKDRKRAILKARLAKVKRRKLIREGKNPDEFISDASDTDSEDDGLIGPNINEKGDSTSKEPELLVRDENIKAGASAREWDIGKKEVKIFSEETWLEERRSERVEEFAPPQMYNDSLTRKPQISFFSPSAKKIVKSEKKLGTKLEQITDKQAMQSFIIKDPMALLEENLCDITAEDPVVPDKTFSHSKNTNCIKSTDPMAMLEGSLVTNTENKAEKLKDSETNISSIESNVLAGLQMIRSQIDINTKNESETETKINIHQTSNLKSIPLPTTNLRSQKVYNNDRVESNFTSNVNTYSEEYNNYYKQYYDYQQNGASVAESSQRKQFEADQLKFSDAKYISCIAVDNKTCVETNPLHTLDTCDSVQKNDNNLKSTTSSEPQPAHFAAGPTKIDPRLAKIPRYERVNLYEVPDELPAPPSIGNIPLYPSMEDYINAENDKKPKNVNNGQMHDNENALIKKWQRQFEQNDDKVQKQGKLNNDISRIKPVHIPFVSPYVQKCSDSDEKDMAGAMFDPSKPPPSIA